MPSEENHSFIPAISVIEDLIKKNRSFFITPLVNQQKFAYFFEKNKQLEDIRDYSDGLKKLLKESGAEEYNEWLEGNFTPALKHPEIRQYLNDNSYHMALLSWQQKEKSFSIQSEHDEQKIKRDFKKKYQMNTQETLHFLDEFAARTFFQQQASQRRKFITFDDDSLEPWCYSFGDGRLYNCNKCEYLIWMEEEAIDFKKDYDVCIQQIIGHPTGIQDDDNEETIFPLEFPSPELIRPFFAAQAEKGREFIVADKNTRKVLFYSREEEGELMEANEEDFETFFIPEKNNLSM
ncbi:hypothetical protein [Legionella septentrionalis]|uniref:Uncharacterized protein n=1 Tax=Legionella septentrionalis TaxID=2498109 RepID=A0A3S0VAB1_9GAMM|nr:hypothetical protein [Legionella septentrionalis]RUQ85086.1 hypothetical protein EKM59_07630 [Legionella septentrionalis]